MLVTIIFIVLLVLFILLILLVILVITVVIRFARLVVRVIGVGMLGLPPAAKWAMAWTPRCMMHIQMSIVTWQSTPHGARAHAHPCE